MREENRLKILEFLAGGGEMIANLFLIFTLPYGSSYSRIDFSMAQNRGFLVKKIREMQANKKKLQNFYDLLYRLREEGLICGDKKGKGCFLRITSKGKNFLKTLKSKKEESLPSQDEYQKESDNLLKIVIFDIPEKERRKRNWLRSVLKNLKFTMLQKSVWAGKIKLPQRLLEDIERLNLLPFVEIFAVNRTGSLKQIT